MDYTLWERLPNLYQGSDRKITLTNQGKQYLVKFPDPAREKKHTLSYINNVFSEYIGSNIFELAGVPVQKTQIGIYRIGEKCKPVCVCEDFTSEDAVLIEFNNLAISNINSDRSNTTEVADIMETLQENFNQDFYKMVSERFWDTFVLDALIGNTDRHNGNWGFLYHKREKTLTLAPVYDCGSSLLPNISDEGLQRMMEDETEFQNRSMNVYACLREDGKKINYYQFFQKSEAPEFLNAVDRQVPNIPIEEIQKFIQNIEYLSEQRKEFYHKFLSFRYEKILFPAYRRQMRMEKKKETKPFIR